MIAQDLHELSFSLILIQPASSHLCCIGSTACRQDAHNLLDDLQKSAVGIPKDDRTCGENITSEHLIENLMTLVMTLNMTLYDTCIHLMTCGSDGYNWLHVPNVSKCSLGTG